MQLDKNKKDYQKLILFWNEIPIVKKIEPEIWKILEQPARAKIVNLMIKGIPQNEFNDSEAPIRRALSAFEIKKQLELMNIELKITNIYFHLDKLENHGLISEVVTLKTGRRATTYFGRTAKIFIPAQELDLSENKIEFTSKLIRIAETKNPGIDIHVIKSYFNYDSNKGNQYTQKVLTWIEENRKLLDEIDIDYKELYLYLMKLISLDKDQFTLDKKIKKILNIR